MVMEWHRTPHGSHLPPPPGGSDPSNPQNHNPGSRQGAGRAGTPPLQHPGNSCRIRACLEDPETPARMRFVKGEGRVWNLGGKPQICCSSSISRRDERRVGRCHGTGRAGRRHIGPKANAGRILLIPPPKTSPPQAKRPATATSSSAEPQHNQHSGTGRFTETLPTFWGH